MPKSKSGFDEITFTKGDQTRVAYSAVAAHRYQAAGWVEAGSKPAARPSKAAVTKARAAGKQRTAATAAAAAETPDATPPAE